MSAGTPALGTQYQALSPPSESGEKRRNWRVAAARPGGVALFIGGFTLVNSVGLVARICRLRRQHLVDRRALRAPPGG